MIVLSVATSADAPAIQQLLHDSWQVLYSHRLSPATLAEISMHEQSLEYLTQQIEDSEIYFLVARDDRTLVGVATARMQATTVEIIRLNVYCLRQRKGIGTRLLEGVLTHFPQATTFRVLVDVENERARHFYERQGFQPLNKVTEKMGRESLDRWLMEKSVR